MMLDTKRPAEEGCGKESAVAQRARRRGDKDYSSLFTRRG